MRGGLRKTRKRKAKKTPTKTVTSETVSSPITEESNVVSDTGVASPLPSTPKRGRRRTAQSLEACCSDIGVASQSPACLLPSTPKRGRRRTSRSLEACCSDIGVASQSPECLLPCTPKRGRRRTAQSQEACCTSTPIRSSSTNNLQDPPPGKQAELEYTEIITRLKTSEVDSPCSKSKSQSKCNGRKAFQPRKRRTKEQLQTCKDLPSKRPRPRFELKKPDVEEKDETLLSSDLSIELSHDKEQLPSLSFQEDEESDEDELPSFLMQMDKKSLSITEGAFVWCKFRNYPFWPALVKSVNRKQKKASILFIDDPKMQKKKGFSVALKTLKPFECAEAKELVCKAKETYDAAIVWSLDLIADYRIRIACGSFSGSFIDYFAHAMSYPVRRMYPQAASERLTITSDSVLEELSDDLKEDSFSEQQGEVSRSSKRLLPDRTHAAHNRANEKLVHFIVKQRMVEGRLLAVIRGQEQSRWLHSFLRAKRRQVVNIYLEDDQQLDQVYWYLNELYASAVSTAPCLDKVKSIERVPFVLDVLLPEAIIHAIAGVDKVSLKKAEEKYLKGRCISNRERQEFDLMIEQEIRKKSQHQNTSHALFSDPIT